MAQLVKQVIVSTFLIRSTLLQYQQTGLRLGLPEQHGS